MFLFLGKIIITIWVLMCVHIYADTGILYKFKVLTQNISSLLSSNAQTVSDKEIDSLQLPPGFNINVYASVPNARSLALADDGIVLVGSRRAGKIYAVLPNKQRNHADSVIEVDSGLDMPNGVAYKSGDLYVAAVNKLIKYKQVLAHLGKQQTPITILDSLPKATHHGWRYLKFGPDGWLYVSIGAPCNVCLSADKRFASIMRMREDGSSQQIYAHGVRNSLGFAWHPVNKNMWFTENGRDWLGDDLPDDEINSVEKPGSHFGFPYVYANNIVDSTYGKNINIKSFVMPKVSLQAHTAPLGLLFYTGNQFPEKYKGQLFVAQHGSWNRTHKVGYKLSLIKFDNEYKSSEITAFVTGWLQGEKYWGRPVDLLQMPDGSILVSDDYAGVIYRISYSQKSVGDKS